jgi:TRAP-type C4-dicarboxylate transport system permease large subunit
VTGVPYFRLLKYTVPYLVALISVWILVALTPELALSLLPNR